MWNNENNIVQYLTSLFVNIFSHMRQTYDIAIKSNCTNHKTLSVILEYHILSAGSTTSPPTVNSTAWCAGVHRGPHPAAVGNAVCLTAPPGAGCRGSCAENIPASHWWMGDQWCPDRPPKGQKEVTLGPPCWPDTSPSCQGISRVSICMCMSM